MAFPTLISGGPATTGGTSNSTTYVADLPPSPSGVAGDVILLLISADGNPTLTISDSGWEKIGQASNGTVVTGALFKYTKTSSAHPTTVTVNSTASEQFTSIPMLIGASGATIIIEAASANGSSTNSNPPNLAITGGAAKDVLWIATRSGDSTVQASADPANYSAINDITAGGNGGASSRVAGRNLNAASEDPGTFTSASEQWVCWTIAAYIGPTVIPVGRADETDTAIERPIAQANITQSAFRLRNDNGSETAATWFAALNADVDTPYNNNYRLRFLIKSVGASSNTGYKLQYNRNSAGWTDIAVLGAVYAANTSNITDGQATTQQIGSGTFVPGYARSANAAATPAIALSADNETELEYCIGFGNSIVAGDLVEFRIVRANGTPLDTYTETPLFTVLRYAYAQNNFRFRNDDGSETTATWKAAANVVVPQSLDVPFRLRMDLQNTGNYVATVSVPYGLQVRLNNGSWQTVETSFKPAIWALSANFVNGAPTTQQISSGTFNAGKINEAADFTTVSLAAGAVTELEYSVKIDSASVSAGNTVAFRFFDYFGQQALPVYDVIEFVVPVPTGLATETDTALALAASFITSNPVGLATETDTALALASRLSQAAGLSVEADTALALNKLITLSRGFSAETDTAFALAAGIFTAVPVGLATETDGAFALNKLLIKPIGLATEADTAFAGTAFQARAVGLAASTNLAFSLTARTILAAGFSTETDAALALSRRISINIGLASETSLASARGVFQPRSTGLSTEIDTALARPVEILGAPVPVGLATETDTALALGKLIIKNLGLASETDSAQGRGVSLKAGLAVETDGAFARALAQPRSIGLATSTEQSFALQAYTTAAVGRAGETSTALGLGIVQARVVQLATEVDNAFNLTVTFPTVLDQTAALLLITRYEHQLEISQPAEAINISIPVNQIEVKQTVPTVEVALTA